MTAYVEKVTAFVTRPARGTSPWAAAPESAAAPELLLFQHPHAGIQIPAGTVEPGEPLEQAVLREVQEETGLSGVRLVGKIGERLERPPNATHIILHSTTVFSRPDPESFDWAHLRRGLPVRLLRQSGRYAQVTYEEEDQFPNASYLTYVITGWVAQETLAEANRRHFFHLALAGSAPEHWQAAADQHIFKPFWAPLDALPGIVAPQAGWLEYVQHTLGYDFNTRPAAKEA